MTVGEYNSCVDRYADDVYRFVLKSLKDEDSASDVVQDVFAKMWEKAADISFEKSKSYLFTAAYHTMIDRIRRAKRWDENGEFEHYTASGYNGYSDLKEVLDEALDKLPPVQKSVLLLRDYEGYKYNEIAEITGLSEAQVKVYIYRARKAMKKYLVKLENLID